MTTELYPRRDFLPCPQYDECPHMRADGYCELDDPLQDCDDYYCEYGTFEAEDEDDDLE